MRNDTKLDLLWDEVEELKKSGGGGSDLPDVTSVDNGKILGVVNGAWNKMDAPSGGVDYSTTEQNTGHKWIDGKDIYQKTFFGTLSNTTITFSLPEGIDKIVSFDGLLKATDGFFPINEFVDTNVVSYTHIIKTDNNYSMAIYSTVKPGSDYSITVNYTKLTTTKKKTTKNKED